MHIRSFVRAAAVAQLVWLVACIQIPIATKPSAVEVDQEPAETTPADLTQVHVAPLYQRAYVAEFAKALTKADARITLTDSTDVWRIALPDRDADAEIGADQFLATEQRTSLDNLGIRFVVILRSTATTTTTSRDFPGLHMLGKWDTATTQRLTLLDLQQPETPIRVWANAAGQANATWVPLPVLLIFAFVTEPDTRGGALDANAGRVAALLAQRVPEGPVSVVVIAEPGPDSSL